MFKGDGASMQLSRSVWRGVDDVSESVRGKGVLIGALVTGVVVLAVAGAAAVVIVDAEVEEPPDPTATRYQVRGEVVSESGQRVCMSDDDAESQEYGQVEVCGYVLSGSAGVLAVGDEVVGDAVEVELDPGSGAHWTIWAYIGPEL